MQGSVIAGAVFHVEGEDIFFIHTFVAQRVDAVADNCRGRVACASFFLLPEQLRSARWPFFEQAGFLGDSVAIWSAPLRPVFGEYGMNRKRDDEAECNEGGNRA